MKVTHQNAIAITDVPEAERTKIQWLVSKDDGAQNFFMRRITIEPGGKTPRHTHNYEHEVYVLSGQGRVLITDRWHEFKKDFVIYVPPNVEHQFENAGNKNLTFLCIIPSM